MPIIVNLDVMLAKRKMTSLELSQRIGLTPANLSILKTGKAKAIRFSTLEAICRELKCQPVRYWSLLKTGRNNRSNMADSPHTLSS